MDQIHFMPGFRIIVNIRFAINHTLMLRKIKLFRIRLRNRNKKYFIARETAKNTEISILMTLAFRIKIWRHFRLLKPSSCGGFVCPTIGSLCSHLIYLLVDNIILVCRFHVYRNYQFDAVILRSWHIVFKLKNQNSAQLLGRRWFS